jgi:large subunit ribosomal protein L25
MKQVSLSGSLRENVGKKDAKRLRREGNVPCVMYGGPEQVHFLASEKMLGKILFTPEVYLIKVVFDGAEYETIVQDVQYHPVTDRMLHVDFLEILPDKPVIVSIPVKLHGTPEGVLRGGKLHKKVRKLKIRALVKDLPDVVDVDITALEIGQSIKISDLTLPKVTFLDVPTNIVVTVRTARTVVEEVPAEAEGAEAAPAEEKKEE